MNDLSEVRRREVAARAILGYLTAARASDQMLLGAITDEVDRRADVLTRWEARGVPLPDDPYTIAAEGLAGDLVGRKAAMKRRLADAEREVYALQRLVADAYRHHPTSLAWCEVTGEMDEARQRALDACDPHPTPTEER